MRRALFFLVVPGLLGGSSAAGELARQDGPMAAPGVSQRSAVATATLEAYWTPARMRAAIPREIVVDHLPQATAEDADGPVRVTASDHEANCVEESVLAPYDYERCDIPDPRPKPWRTHGKVFMTFDGINYVCSGTVVRSPIGRVVWTAGHCLVHELTGSWATNVAFVPAYDEGDAPLGTWSATRLYSTTQWRRDANLNYDLAAFRVARRNGKRLQDVTGARGIAFNQPRSQKYNTFGYPASGEFDGGTLVVCHTAFAENDPAPEENGPGPAPMGVGCDMTPGSSGGSWLNAGEIHSINSFLLAGEDEVMYGPYMGKAAKLLWRAAAGAS